MAFAKGLVLCIARWTVWTWTSCAGSQIGLCPSNLTLVAEPLYCGLGDGRALLHPDCRVLWWDLIAEPYFLDLTAAAGSCYLQITLDFPEDGDGICIFIAPLRCFNQR